ncbi:MAG: hypothetical protein JXB39_14705 [Deltaproteobacteria bacterium]|nr:hypothetical protein [Deltaproteobacteria bacterium]
MSVPHDPHAGADRSDALAHTFPPLPREGEPEGAPSPPVTLADLPDKAFFERQRRSMAREALLGRAMVVLAILALLIANTLAQRAHTRELLQNIDWDRQHQSGIEDDLESSLASIEARLLAIEQRLAPSSEVVEAPAPSSSVVAETAGSEIAPVQEPARAPLAAATAQ